ncbi:MAG TPA: hypothetical protein VE983_03045 [Solirubrobacteraceae bacterium]|nr:hypothetical protein [Solirubrobacteraceae bacterium]
MPGPFLTRTLSRTRLLRKLPLVRLMAVAEVIVLAREHMNKLEPPERRRLVELVRRGRARPSNLSARERRELSALVAKAEPRQFVTRAVEKIAGVPLWSREQDRR